MRVRPEHVVYTDEQIRNMVVSIIDDEDANAPDIRLNKRNGQLTALVRRAFAAEDEADLRQRLEIIRFNWLGVLGYSDEELGFTRSEPVHPEGEQNPDFGFGSGK